MKYQMLMLAFAANSHMLFAASFDKRELVQELVQKLETTDPNIKTHRDEWMKVRSHLESASQQSESEAGLKMSVQHILDQWGGLSFRVLDPSDAQYWALNGQALSLADAWWSQRGSKWLVQYSLNPKLNRGDSVSIKDFSPYSKETQAKSTLELNVQQKPMGEAKNLTVALNKKPLDDWSLDLTQKSASVAIVANKRICMEKVWFWLNESVSRSLASKLDSKKSNCDALVIDLRDVFGEGLPSWPKLDGKLPIAVLTNHGTREGAVRLAHLLKGDGKAAGFGEPTAASGALQTKEKLEKGPWYLVTGGDGGEFIPAKLIRDSYLNAEGVDEIREAGLAYVRAEILR